MQLGTVTFTMCDQKTTFQVDSFAYGQLLQKAAALASPFY